MAIESKNPIGIKAQCWWIISDRLPDHDHEWSKFLVDAEEPQYPEKVHHETERQDDPARIEAVRTDPCRNEPQYEARNVKGQREEVHYVPEVRNVVGKLQLPWTSAAHHQLKHGIQIELTFTWISFFILIRHLMQECNKILTCLISSSARVATQIVSSISFQFIFG